MMTNDFSHPHLFLFVFLFFCFFVFDNRVSFTYPSSRKSQECTLEIRTSMVSISLLSRMLDVSIIYIALSNRAYFGCRVHPPYYSACPILGEPIGINRSGWLISRDPQLSSLTCAWWRRQNP